MALKGPALLSLKTATQELSLPLGKAVWLSWCLLTYPLQIAAGYYFFGIDGLIFVAILTTLNFRGKIT